MPGAAADFLRLILADPDADGPRLMYADWLDSQGHPERAEFIRVQCAAAALPADDPGVEVLRRRGDVLLEQHRVEWGEALAGLAARWDWRRGFPETVRMEARMFLDRGEELFAAVPVQHVELLDVAGHLPALGQCRGLERLTVLTVTGCPAGNPLAEMLARSPYVGGLRGLHLPCNGLADAAARNLSAASQLERLTTLDLGGNEIGPGGAHALAAAAHFRRVKTLRLRFNPLGPDGLAAILTSSRLEGVTTLDLARTDGTAAALERVPAGGRLAVLNLSGNDWGNIGAQNLARWPSLARLIDLDLSRSGIGDDGAAALAASPYLTGLRRLALNGNRISEAGKRQLLAAPHFQKLPTLELRDNWQ
jgi:uncharacterized protein (TIGR02996 family)